MTDLTALGHMRFINRIKHTEVNKTKLNLEYSLVRSWNLQKNMYMNTSTLKVRQK